MESESLLEDLKRKTQLLEDDMTELVKLCNKVISLGERKDEDYHRMVEASSKYPRIEDEIVRFNVGGSVFATSKTNITKKIPVVNPEPLDENEKSQLQKFYEPNMFEGLVSGIIQVKLDSTGAIFIDRNPKHFDLILDFLRMANTSTEFKLSPKFSDWDELQREAEFYNVKALLAFLNPPLTIQSVILNQPQLAHKFIQLIKSSKPNGHLFKSLKLLYRATEHSFNAPTFHERCDNKGSTISIVKAANTNYIFGGYTSLSWDSSGTYKQDKDAFLFSLVNRNEQPLIITCDPASGSSIYCHTSYGPTFGNGHDLHICNSANTVGNSYSNLNTAYKHSNFVNKTPEAQILFAGSNKFTVSEIEVFQVILQN